MFFSNVLMSYWKPRIVLVIYFSQMASWELIQRLLTNLVDTCSPFIIPGLKYLESINWLIRNTLRLKHSQFVLLHTCMYTGYAFACEQNQQPVQQSDSWPKFVLRYRGISASNCFAEHPPGKFFVLTSWGMCSETSSMTGFNTANKLIHVSSNCCRLIHPVTHKGKRYRSSVLPIKSKLCWKQV